MMICYHVYRVSSLSTLLSPFDLTTWILTLASMAVSVLAFVAVGSNVFVDVALAFSALLQLNTPNGWIDSKKNNKWR